MATINLILPTCWQELTPRQLRYVYFLFSQERTADEVKTYCLCRFGGLKVIGQEGDNWRVMYDHRNFLVSAVQIAEQLSHLSWLDSLPLQPVRLPQIGKHTAVNADLSGVPFRDYLYCDNLYTGWLHSRNADLLTSMAKVLYRAQDIKLNKEEQVGVFWWFASLKAYYQRRFHWLFDSAPSEGGNLLSDQRGMAERLQSAMDNQIRALTKGDVTKEGEVLATDTVRALTELDALAREYQELQKEMRK